MNLALDVTALPAKGSRTQVQRRPGGVLRTTTDAVRAAARFAYDLLNELF
jgi:hypothetical protein